MAKLEKKGKKETPQQVAKKSSESEVLPMGRINFIMIAVSVLLIAVGFAFMTGSANVGATFNASIFDSSRTLVGPMLSLAGFILIVPSIMYRSKKDKNTEEK